MKNMELKKELLDFLEANNNFGLIEGLVEGIVDTYISAYKECNKSLNEQKMSEQSAVEWFAEKVGHNSLISLVEYNELLEQAKEIEQEQSKVTENTSDGYHTFKELYDFRKAYNVALFNEWASQVKEDKTFCMNEDGKILEVTTKREYKYNVHKSWRHHDNEFCFGGGWFIVVAVLPDGQISNHYKAEDWDLFNIPEEPKALFAFDGHTGQDVIERLLKLKVN